MKHTMNIAQIIPLEDGTFAVGFAAKMTNDNLRKVLAKGNNQELKIEVDLFE